MAPPYVDDNPNLESVRQGMDLAEDEKREMIADGYETIARGSNDAEAALDDIDRTLEDGGDTAPELGAMHRSGPDEDR
jgi:hypothetical protein